jgi:hypothetical protein
LAAKRGKIKTDDPQITQISPITPLWISKNKDMLIKEEGVWTKMENIIHPYKEYENTKLWSVISRAICDLVDNTDIQETTQHEYIVGYIVKKVSTEMNEEKQEPRDSN